MRAHTHLNDTDQSGDSESASNMTDRVSDTTSDDDDNASVIYPSLGRASAAVVGHSVSRTQQLVNDTSSSEAGCVGNGRSEGQKEKP